MASELMRSVIGTLVCTVSVFMLSGCGNLGPIRDASVRSKPAEIQLKLSPGDTRQEVRTLLGQPLIDSRRLGLEMYRLTGTDLDIHLFYFVPVPLPGKDVTVRVLVVYDDHDIVKDIASGLWDYSDRPGERWINAGGFSLLNTYPPSILVGPPLSQEELAPAPITDGRCVLYLLLNDYFMGEVSLDGNLFVDLKGFPRDYWNESDFKKYAAFNGLFLRKEIAPGPHVLSHRLRYPVGEFERTFVCSQSETLYAQLDVKKITHNNWWWSLWGFPRLEGSITVNKSAPRSVLESNKLRPVLWSHGEWFSDSWYIQPN